MFSLEKVYKSNGESFNNFNKNPFLSYIKKYLIENYCENNKSEKIISNTKENKNNFIVLKEVLEEFRPNHIFNFLNPNNFSDSLGLNNHMENSFEKSIKDNSCSSDLIDDLKHYFHNYYEYSNLDKLKKFTDFTFDFFSILKEYCLKVNNTNKNFIFLFNVFSMLSNTEFKQYSKIFSQDNKEKDYKWANMKIDTNRIEAYNLVKNLSGYISLNTENFKYISLNTPFLVYSGTNCFSLYNQEFDIFCNLLDCLLNKDKLIKGYIENGDTKILKVNELHSVLNTQSISLSYFSCPVPYLADFDFNKLIDGLLDLNLTKLNASSFDLMSTILDTSEIELSISNLINTTKEVIKSEDKNKKSIYLQKLNWINENHNIDKSSLSKKKENIGQIILPKKIIQRIPSTNSRDTFHIDEESSKYVTNKNLTKSISNKTIFSSHKFIELDAKNIIIPTGFNISQIKREIEINLPYKQNSFVQKYIEKKFDVDLNLILNTKQFERRKKKFNL